MSDSSVKQQIDDKVKDSTNILVTVSDYPSVDELSAALGLSLLLNKMKKHATAVFSGEIPPAITFLDPAKTFENTVESLTGPYAELAAENVTITGQLAHYKEVVDKSTALLEQFQNVAIGMISHNGTQVNGAAPLADKTAGNGAANAANETAAA